MNALSTLELVGNKVEIDRSFRDVKELNVSIQGYAGSFIPISVQTLVGVEEIQVVQVFIAGVRLTGTAPTYPWYDLIMTGIPNNRLNGQSGATLRIHNSGERTLTTHQDRVIFRSRHPEGVIIQPIEIQIRRPDGTLAATGDLTDFSIDLRITYSGSSRQ